MIINGISVYVLFETDTPSGCYKVRARSLRHAKRLADILQWETFSREFGYCSSVDYDGRYLEYRWYYDN